MGQGSAALACSEPLDAASPAVYASFLQYPAALPAELGAGEPETQANPLEESEEPEDGRPRKRSRRAPSRAPATSRYRGVSFHTQTQRWKAQIKVGGRDVNLGRHTGEQAAARAYDRASICARGAEGAAARLNFHVGEYAGELEMLAATPLAELAATLRGMERRMSSLTSRYHGVRLNKRSLRWEAYIRVGGKHIHMGCYASEVTAAQVYDQAAILRHAHTLSALGPAETARLHTLVTNFAPQLYQALLAGGCTAKDGSGAAADGGGAAGGDRAERGDGGADSGAASKEQATDSGSSTGGGAALDSIAQLGASHFQQLETKFAQALLERCHEVGAAELAWGAENLPPQPAGRGAAAQRGAAALASQLQQAHLRQQTQAQQAGAGGCQAPPAAQSPAGDQGEEVAADKEEVAAAAGLLPLEWLSAMHAAMVGPGPPLPSQSAASNKTTSPYPPGPAVVG